MIAAFGLAVSACAVAVDPITRNAPLKLAFTEPVSELESRAETGDRPAQYALSYLAKFGLRGVASDPVRVESLRARAGQDLSRAQPIYVPGVNGRPGTTTMVTISDPGISDMEAARLDLCGATLLLGQPAAGGQLCGSPAAYADLLPAAYAVRLEAIAARLPAPVDPSSVTDCALTDDLWGDASLRMATNDVEGAEAAAGRIIELCGDGERSWHARVMSAVIAMDKGDPGRALTRLDPVPSPTAPAPIGGFGELVRIAALDASGEAAAAAAARTALVRASADALRSEASRLGRRIDSRAMDGGTLIAVDRPGAMMGVIQTLRVYVFEPAADTPVPTLEAYRLTRHMEGGQLSGPWFLDAFACDHRATLGLFDAEPSLDEVAARITTRRAEGSRVDTAISGMTLKSGSTCQWPVQVVPGLGDDPETQRLLASAPSTPAP